MPHMRLNVYKNHDNAYYLETEEADEINGEIVFKPAIPFRTDHLISLAESILVEENSSTLSIFPEDLLYISNHSCIIFQKPQMQLLKFSKSLKIKNQQYPLPGLIFLLNNTSLYVYAYFGKERPHNATELFKAPFYNMFTEGQICMGDNKMHKLSGIKNKYDAIHIARSIFFESEFSHYVDARVLNSLTLEEYYRESKKILTKKDCVSLNTTLQKTIKNAHIG